jgi:hypothetical protein
MCLCDAGPRSPKQRFYLVRAPGSLVQHLGLQVAFGALRPKPLFISCLLARIFAEISRDEQLAPFR